MVLYEIWDVACPILIRYVPTRINYVLVGIDINHPTITRERVRYSRGHADLEFYVTLSPMLYKDGQGVLQIIYSPQAIETTKLDVGYYATRGPNLSKPLCILH